MIRRVDIVFSRFAKLGHHVTGSHPEATGNLDYTLLMIHGLDCEAERAFNPSKPPSPRDHLVAQVAHAMQPIHLEIDAKVEVRRIHMSAACQFVCRYAGGLWRHSKRMVAFAPLSTPCVMKC